MAAVNHFYVLNIGMNINPNFNVIYLFNNLQLRNTLYDHDILAFIIPTLLSLVQIICPADQDLFRTHPMAMSVVRSSLLAYCLAFSLWVLSIRHYARGQNLAYAHFWCPMAMRLFGSVSVTSLLYILFPHDPSWQPLIYILIAAYFAGIDFASARTLLAASALHFVGGSVAAAAEIAPKTGEKDMSNFAADHNGYATRIVVNTWPPFSMVFRM
ncbi:unnamed protein product [Prunus armeniaca]|uniref:Uncharacterized protein n=1 Tax=Prunus armeniaca TaxID=36596 RepID=A0A6J5WE99_PRUAR|nr:unnamed protein product [Prunus armeniaca]